MEPYAPLLTWAMVTPTIEFKREMLKLGEALSTGKPGGELLGDLKLGESSVAKTGAGGDVGGYPILAKMLGSAGSFF